ncbi:MAG: flagellar hook-basal body complex protein [Lachnospiraceae bacterium]|nr:flagellar hook-basal body complex protein [Lachnospiraceae bacterium]
MYQSFYTASVGAAQYTNGLGITANNLSNINNYGYKSKRASFADLIEYNLNDSEEAQTDLHSGVGTRIVRTSMSFEVGAFQPTGSQLDYAITRRNTFFVLQDPETGDVTYSRNGHFHRAEQEDGFYLMTDSGKYVLDVNGERIRAESENGQGTQENPQEIALVTFENPSRLMSVGFNEYVPSDENAAAIPVQERALVGATLESSDTDMAEEFTHVIEYQRAFSFAARMITTSDEIVSTINTLRS